MALCPHVKNAIVILSPWFLFAGCKPKVQFVEPCFNRLVVGRMVRSTTVKRGPREYVTQTIIYDGRQYMIDERGVTTFGFDCLRIVTDSLAREDLSYEAYLRSKESIETDSASHPK